MEHMRPHSATLSQTGLTDLFQAAAGVSSPQVRSIDPTCAKMLSFSQNTAGGMFAESQELGCAFVLDASSRG